MTRVRFLECGKIQNTHGVRGLVRVESYCDSPAVLAALKTVYLCEGESYKPLVVKNASRMQETVLMQFEGIDDMDAAALLKNQVLYAAREDIPLSNGAYFLADLPGLPVLDAKDGRLYGEVREVREIGARNFLIVLTPAGERMVPMVPAFVARVDVSAAVYVTPIPGLLADED